MTTTAVNMCAGGEQCNESATMAGVAATRRWFPDSEDLQRRIDAIVHEVKLHRQQGCLFAADAIDSCQPTRYAVPSLDQLASQAYLSMLQAVPEDHVVIDPAANQEFINRCRLLGATVSEFLLNKAILNVRKAGKWHRGLERGSVPSLGREVLDRVGYAAEMAARLVQLREIEAGAARPTVDRILCDPSLRELFDEAVCDIAPGYSVYEYRRAVLAYRKSGRESSVRLGQTSVPRWEASNVPFRTFDPDDVPASPGIYRIDAGSRALFVSATLNLRTRLLAHLAVDDRQSLLPASLWDPPKGRLVVRWFETPPVWKPRRADAVAQRMKVKDKAMYNLYACTA